MSKKKQNLRDKVLNTIMISGKKRTAENILLRSFKYIQRTTHKNYVQLLQQAVVNATPTLKLDKQRIKKGKRKSVKEIPAFITNESLRTVASLKLIKKTTLNNSDAKTFYQKFAKEILQTSKSNSQSIVKKTELHKQALLKKRFLKKFKWK